MATNSYFPPKSDIDLIIVVEEILDSNLAKELNLSIAKFINRCYEGSTLIDVDILRWTKYPVFTPALWIFIFDDALNIPVALGIADYDASIREGSLEWIQVLPENRDMGLGKAIVNELLSSLKKLADFVTVSGECDNPTNPESLYRKSGFKGNDIWYLFREDTTN